MIAERTLVDVYFAIRQKPGWFADLVEAGWSNEDLNAIEKLDDQFSSYQPELDAEKWAQEIMFDGGPDILACETDEEKIGVVSKALQEFYGDSESVMRGSWSYIEIQIRDGRLKQLQKLRQKFRARQVHRDQPDAFSIPEWQIVKAREYPLHRVLGIEDGERIACPFHGGERKNFSVKNGWGYCFQCGESCDSIKWLMTQERFSFLGAIRKLQS